MDTLKEQLIEIVEKEQSEKILPFLQKLTPEEKESLHSSLIKLEENYNTPMQLDEKSYSTRATLRQHRILHLAALVIFPLKDFCKHEGGIYVGQLEEVLPWYIPTWLDTYYKLKENKQSNGFYGMNYETLMDWTERGILHVSPSPEAIARYLVDYINDTDILQRRPITLKEHIWYLFQYTCGQNWADQRSGKQPYHSFRYFIEHGQLDRIHVLRESLLATNRNLNKNLCAWFAGMFEVLHPSIEEQLLLQPEMLGVLSTRHSRPANIILDFIGDLCHHPQFQTKEFLNQTGSLFTLEVKSVTQSTLAILSQLAKEQEKYRDDICCAAVQGLLNRDASIQNRIAKLIITYGSTESVPLKQALSAYTNQMLSTTRRKLEPYIDVTIISTPKNKKLSNFYISRDVPGFSPENDPIQEVSDIEGLTSLACRTLESDTYYQFYVLLSALIRWTPQMEAEKISEWTFTLQYAYQLLKKGSPHTGILDRMIAIFIFDYIKLLIKRFPESGKRLSALHEEMVQTDEKLKGTGDYLNLQSLTVRQSFNKEIDFPIHRHLLCHTLDLLEENNKDNPPLLSTPTHKPMYIAPLILVERLKQYQQAGVEPDVIDMQLALSRVALDTPSQTLQDTIIQELEGEFQHLLLFLFGKEDVLPQPPFTHPSWWMTAGIIKSPETVYPQFKDFPYDEETREYLSGNFSWDTYPASALSSEEEKNDDYHSKCSSPLLATMFARMQHASRRVCPPSPLPLLGKLFASSQAVIKNDWPRLIWFAPNTPETVLAWSIYHAMWDPMLHKMKEANITQVTLIALYQLKHTWHNTSYLLEACSMLTYNSDTRTYAAELWADRVCKKCIDSSRLGSILGLLQSTEWAPVKRLTDLIEKQMFNLSPSHNRELEKLLTAMLVQFPEKRIKGLKKLLEIYSEVLSLNHSKVEDERLLHLLEGWK